MINYQNSIMLDVSEWKISENLDRALLWKILDNREKKIWFLVGVRICIFCIEDKQASESATKGGIQKLRFSNQNEVRGHSITTYTRKRGGGSVVSPLGARDKR